MSTSESDVKRQRQAVVEQAERLRKKWGITPTNPYARPFGTSRSIPPEPHRDAELDVPEDDAIEPPIEDEMKSATATRLVDDEDDDPPLRMAGGAR